MNEDEVEAWAEKLARIWNLKKVDQWGFFDRHCYLEAHFDSQTTLDINPLIEMNCCSLIQHPSVLGALEDGEIYVQSIEGDSTDEVTKERHCQQLAQEWMPGFRRGCWLMGYDIAASDEEKAQWQRSFTNEGEVAQPAILSEKIKWERRRVAAAFGVEGWEECVADSHSLDLEGYSCSSESSLEWGVSGNSIKYILVYWQDGAAEVWFDKGVITSIELKEHIELEEHVDSQWLMRGLYQLGFEDEDVLA